MKDKEILAKNNKNSSNKDGSPSLHIRKTLKYFVQDIGDVCFDADKINIEEMDFEIFKTKKLLLTEKNCAQNDQVDITVKNNEAVEDIMNKEEDLTTEIDKTIKASVKTSLDSKKQRSLIYYKNISSYTGVKNPVILQLTQKKLPDIQRKNNK